MKSKQKVMKAWAIINPDDKITSTKDAYNHWGGNDALCLFHSRYDAAKFACKDLDRIVRVKIRELK